MQNQSVLLGSTRSKLQAMMVGMSVDEIAALALLVDAGRTALEGAGLDTVDELVLRALSDEFDVVLAGDERFEKVMRVAGQIHGDVMGHVVL